ncbi:MAG: DUF1887 family protein [Candidatus Adiutrix sp.]|nr:DUF1887 family protein [Candidatus Adiutrix sp.]
MSEVQRSFVSIVGQTAIAMLQPLMAYRQLDAGALSSIELLVTTEVQPRLPGLERALAEIAPDLPLNIHALSQRAGGPEEGRSAAELYRELERRGPLAINVMGGTNFMSAAGLCALERPEEHVFLQGLNNSFCLVEPATAWVPVFLPPPPAKSTPWLLELQGLAWKEAPPGPLKDLCRDHGLALPASALLDVEIAGRRFDCVWNSGPNFLNFLVLLDSYDLKESRYLLALALDKKRLSLYSRNIHVLAASDRTYSRLKLEGPGKIKPWPLDWRSPPESPAGREVGRKLKELFQDWATRKSKAWQPPRTEPVEPEPLKTLVLLSGPSGATLSAIVSHACPQVILCHTGADRRISDLTEALARKAPELGVKNLIKWPTTHEAWDLLNSLPRTFQGPVEVNISPGGKAHAAALSMWARQVGASVWGFNHGERGHSPLERLPLAGEAAAAGPGPEKKPRRPISIKTHLEIFSAAEVRNFGRSPEDFGGPFYDRMLEFMRRLWAGGKFPKNFWTASLAWEGFELRNSSAQGRRELIWPETADGPAGSHIFSTLNDGGQLTGGWYEELAAKAFRRLDPAWDIRVGVEVAWPKANRTPPKVSPHLTERDVLLRADNALYCVSCKTDSPSDGRLAEVAREAESMAKVLGRFTIPLVLTMSPGQPKPVEGVMTCGWVTLCDSGRLRDFLKTAARSAWGESAPQS